VIFLIRPRPLCQQHTRYYFPRFHELQEFLYCTFFPVNGFGYRHDDGAVFKERHHAGGFRYGNGQRVGARGDPSRGHVPGAKPAGQRLGVELGPQVATGGEDDAVAGDDEGPVDAREFLDGFGKGRVQNVSLRLAIAPKGVDDELSDELIDRIGVADNENGAQWLALAAFHGDFPRQSQNTLQHLRLDIGRQDGGRIREKELVFRGYIKGNDGVENPELRIAGNADYFVGVVEEIA